MRGCGVEEAGGGSCVDYCFFVFAGPPCDEGGEKEWSGYWMERVEVVGAGWVMRVAREMSVDCVALLVDLCNNKA